MLAVNGVGRLAAEDAWVELRRLADEGQRCFLHDAMIAAHLAGGTLRGIGDEVGMSGERVRQIISAELSRNPRIPVGKDWPEFRSLLERWRTRRAAVPIICARPGIEWAELASYVGVSVPTCKDAVPAALRKFVGVAVPREAGAQLRFSEADLLDALAIAAELVAPFTHQNYQEYVDRADFPYPSAITVIHRFGSWYAACVRAGVDWTGVTRRDRSDGATPETCLPGVVAFLLSPVSTTSVAAYDPWRSEQSEWVPSSSLLRNVFGSWSLAVHAGLDDIASSDAIRAWLIRGEAVIEFDKALWAVQSLATAASRLYQEGVGRLLPHEAATLGWFGSEDDFLATCYYARVAPVLPDRRFR